ncbi:MAG TPA: hypothetical protein K8V56_15340 [Sporosarcina psychrophila]|uniref:Uncharacterized protein n=1 Tax=Sporosarcina psychrophila TaxID=1476 RepID=A0A921KEE1_SPOPS|nr:hypothetical protein [Sporosarcina psychrophila]
MEMNLNDFMQLTCGGHNKAYAEHIRSHGEHNGAHAEHIRSHGEHNGTHAGHNRIDGHFLQQKALTN